MFKKLILSATLSLTLAGGTLAAVAATAPVAVAAPAAQTLPAAQLAVVQAPAAFQAAQLSTAHMAEVKGDGLWSKFKKWVKKVIKKVIGVIIQEIIKAITDWVEDSISSISGYENLNTTTADVEHYSSQANYDAGIVSSMSYEDSGWQQTQVYYGYNTRERQYMQAEMMQAY